MALIVEDGTSLANAESYISVANADTYHSARGATLWDTLTTTEKEQALRRATDYMIAEYRDRWSGYRTTATQSLDWPRKCIYIRDMPTVSEWPSTFIPNDVIRACAELAIKAAAGELLEDTEQKIIEDTIGPITTKWDPKSSQKKKYPFIDAMFKMYMSSGSNGINVTLVRC